MTTMSETQEDVFAECFADDRRPSVTRATSLPSTSAAAAPGMFVSTSDDQHRRPPLPRACSEGVATGVLERRRRKALTENGAAPLNLVLDFNGLSSKVALANVALMKAARRAVTEPREWDWGFGGALENNAVAGPSTYFGSLSSSSSMSAPARTNRSEHVSANLQEEDALRWARQRLCQDLPVRDCDRPASGASEASRYGVDCEWDWALGGRCRVPAELYCGRQSVPRRIAKEYLPKEEMLRTSRRAKLLFVSLEQELESRLIDHHHQVRHASDQLALHAAGDDHRHSRSRQKAVRAHSHRLNHKHKASLQIFTTALDLGRGEQRGDDDNDDVAVAPPSSSKSWSPFEGAREHALGSARSRSVGRCRSAA